MTHSPNSSIKENLRAILKKMLIATGILAVVYFVVQMAEGKLKNRN